MSPTGALQRVADLLEIKFNVTESSHLVTLVTAVEKRIVGMVPEKELADVSDRLRLTKQRLDVVEREAAATQEAFDDLEAHLHEKAEEIVQAWLVDDECDNTLVREFRLTITEAIGKAERSSAFAKEVEEESLRAQKRAAGHVHMQGEKILKLTKEMASRELREDAPHLKELLQEERRRALADAAAIADVHGAEKLAEALRFGKMTSLPMKKMPGSLIGSISEPEDAR